ncbi:hypothetical protein BY458DRAFT_531229 [Sporodiniella umbellata]|nr:hypothetical protein BY458DRAFT_531229 [Sporodiniella umbellata]
MSIDTTLDVILSYLSTHKLDDRLTFSTLRTALYNTTQYDHEKAWAIYNNMIQYKVNIFLKPNHYGTLLCILKFGHSPYNLLKVVEDMRQHSTPNDYHYSQILFAFQRFGLAEEAYEYIKTLEDPRPNHFHSLIIAIRKSKKADPALLEKVVVLMLENMKSRDLELDNTTRAVTIALLADFKKSELIIEFLKSVDTIQQTKRRKKVRPYNIYMYTSLISGCARKADALGAKALYEEMKKNDLKPNQVTYTALMEAYGRAGDFTSAIRLMTKHQRQFRKINNSMVTSLVVNAIRHDNLRVAKNAMAFITKKNIKLTETDGVLRAAILWLKIKNDVSDARRYFDELYANDARLVNNVMVNHLITEYGRQGNKKGVVEMYENHLKLPKQPSSEEIQRTKHYLIDALFHCRDVPIAISVFVSMRNQAMSDEITMAMIIKGLVLNNEGDLAWSLFKTLQSNGTEPNLHAYTSVLKSLGNKGSYMEKKTNPTIDRLDPRLLKSAGIKLSDLDFNPSPVPTTTEAIQLFRRLTGFHKPNIYIYTTLISCFAKNNIYQAVTIFEHMCLKQVKPTVETYTALLQGCAIFRNKEIAYAVFKHMNDNEVEPNELTWMFFMKALLRSRTPTAEVDVVGEFSRMALEN